MTQQLKQDLEGQRGGDIKFIETVPLLTTCTKYWFRIYLCYFKLCILLNQIVKVINTNVYNFRVQGSRATEWSVLFKIVDVNFMFNFISYSGFLYDRNQFSPKYIKTYVHRFLSLISHFFLTQVYRVSRNIRSKLIKHFCFETLKNYQIYFSPTCA